MSTSYAARAAAADERLVHFVRDRVRDADGHRTQFITTERAEEQQPEHGVRSGVRELAKQQVPASEPCPEVAIFD